FEQQDGRLQSEDAVGADLEFAHIGLAASRRGCGGNNNCVAHGGHLPGNCRIGDYASGNRKWSAGSAEGKGVIAGRQRWETEIALGISHRSSGSSSGCTG